MYYQILLILSPKTLSNLTISLDPHHHLPIPSFHHLSPRACQDLSNQFTQTLSNEGITGDYFSDYPHYKPTGLFKIQTRSRPLPAVTSISNLSEPSNVSMVYDLKVCQASALSILPLALSMTATVTFLSPVSVILFHHRRPFNLTFSLSKHHSFPLYLVDIYII